MLRKSASCERQTEAMNFVAYHTAMKSIGYLIRKDEMETPEEFRERAHVILLAMAPYQKAALKYAQATGAI